MTTPQGDALKAPPQQSATITPSSLGIRASSQDGRRDETTPPTSTQTSSLEVEDGLERSSAGVAIGQRKAAFTIPSQPNLRAPATGEDKSGRAPTGRQEGAIEALSHDKGVPKVESRPLAEEHSAGTATTSAQSIKGVDLRSIPIDELHAFINSVVNEKVSTYPQALALVSCLRQSTLKLTRALEKVQFQLQIQREEVENLKSELAVLRQEFGIAKGSSAARPSSKVRSSGWVV